MRTSCSIALAIALLAIDCSSTPDAQPEPTAETYYEEGLSRLEPRRVLFFFRQADTVGAIESFQQVIDNFPFSDFATLAELKIADANFDRGRYEDAASFYQEFVELHPSHPDAAYALLRLSECTSKQMLAPDQDPGKTRELLDQCESFLQRFPSASPELVDRAQELCGRARNQLALKEVMVADFYFDTEKYHAAEPRYRSALEKAPQHPGYKRTLARLSRSLRELGREQESERIEAEVLANDPTENALLALGVEYEVDEPGRCYLFLFGNCGANRRTETIVRPVPEAPAEEGGCFLGLFGCGDGEEEQATLPEPARRPLPTVARKVEPEPEPVALPVVESRGQVGS